MPNVKPVDAVVANGWYFYIPYPGIGDAAIFETLSGIGETTESVSIVDAGTNKKIKFSTQIVDYSDMTLTRTRQNNTVDWALANFCRDCMQQNLKVPARAVKMHNGNEIFSIVFEGFSMKSKSHPDWDISSTEKFLETFTATCDGYEEIPTGV